MRRIRLARIDSGDRRLLGLYKWEYGDDCRAMVTWLWNSTTLGRNRWATGTTADGLPWKPSSLWPYVFVFSDCSFGLCREGELTAALENLGLRLTEGGE